MRVLFDEGHSEAWTIRPELATQMQPAHPADASYARAAAELKARGFTVSANAEPLTGGALRGADLLVIAHPADAAWERTTGIGSPRLTGEELDSIEAYVRGGGGLLVLGETEQDKYGNNVNDLLARFGLRLENETVQDYEHCLQVPSWILAELNDGGRGRGGDLLARVASACLYRATTISPSNGARVVARTHTTASIPSAPVIVSSEQGAGRIVVLADSDLFGDDCIDDLDHRALWSNLCHWAARSQDTTSGRRARDRDTAWNRLRDTTNELARLQAPDGSLREGTEIAREHVPRIVTAIQELASGFEHQREYLHAVVGDLGAWVENGFGKPDFTRSLEAFRPDRDRRDGIENLVVFPMYKQNGSRDTCFEALIVRVPWPDWIAELERTRYDNPKFVPVELVDSTDGYRSECATLFPETVSVAGRPVNNFGAIFCDREAERLRRVAGRATDLLRLNLPPDASRMLDSPEISQQAYILWDLIHDRTHSHGELPFDPFMVRQRAPYWMYSLEELRCDLTAFTEALGLERGGLTFAAYVQYAILLDRLLRFPITGTRTRNYDGLGGQLLFAHLHRGDYLSWADNRLTISWDRVAEGVAGLRHEIDQLYRAGIDRTKLQHWAAAHDLVASRVPPASGSRWAASVRDFAEVEDPRPYVDLVREDEFPLSIFYSSLKTKLAA
jgi:Family of unknown function (DUF6421)/Domain of unknown function (DUF4350)